MKNINDKKAQIALLIVTIIWGAGFPITEIAIEYGFNTLAILAFRFLIAALFLNIIFYKKIRTIKKDVIKYGSITGVILLFNFFFQILAQSYLSSSTVAFMTQGFILFIPLVTFLIMKTKPDIYDYAAVIITLIGLSILMDIKLDSFNIGYIIMITFMLICALHVVITSHYQKKYKLDPIEFTTVQFTIGAIIIFPLSILIPSQYPSNLTIISFWPLIFLGLFNSGVCFTIQSIALKYSNPLKVGLIVSFEAFFAAITGIILINEVITINIILGGVLITLAVITANTKLAFLRKKKQ